MVNISQLCYEELEVKVNSKVVDLKLGCTSKQFNDNTMYSTWLFMDDPGNTRLDRSTVCKGEYMPQAIKERF
jgi:hypothetical protein